MENWVNELNTWYSTYCDSFKELTADQKKNFEIKKEHSLRVAGFCVQLADKLDFNSEEVKLAYFVGLFHDVGRYKQLVEFNTFNDAKSVDHAEYSVKIIKDEAILEKFGIEQEDIVTTAILFHNKLSLPKKISEQEIRFAQLLRDADKMDILKVLTEYYSNKNAAPNHTLTWELPKGNSISSAVSKEVLAGKLVSKENVLSDIDVKIMQMSWVFDINFRPTFEYMLRKRFLENIYNTLPKNDTVIEIYTKVKVYSENKLLFNSSTEKGSKTEKKQII